MNKINRQMEQVEGKLDEIERRANKIKIAIDEMGALPDESDQADRSASDQAIEARKRMFTGVNQHSSPTALMQEGEKGEAAELAAKV
jgi:hypothetical protein